ncbi:MAG: hypothetical protein ACFFDH_22565 [Promethearchaeota archaeon]
MKAITDILKDFFVVMRDDILEYYHRSHSYLKDLIIYKKIDLNKKTENEREKNLISNLKKMLKAIKTGLNTIGISIDKLNESQNDFMESLEENRAKIQDYNSYFQIYLIKYVNKILFDILIDYLLEVDTKKLENVNIFDLLPPFFISNLNEFKKKWFNTPEIINLFKQQNLDNYINFKELTFKSEETSELDILKQLQQAKQDIIDTLKTPKKELNKLSTDSEKEKLISDKKIPPSKLIVPSNQDFYADLVSDTFLDYFGRFSPINIDLVNRFNIKKVNLIKSREFSKEYFDLENLYHYISILRMLNIEVPFTEKEILDIVKNFINEKIFSSSKENLPDPKNIFYGLALFLELKLLNKTDLIDLRKIEEYLKLELKNFIPEKLELNLFSLLCLKLLGKNFKIAFNKNLILELLMKINIITLENFSPCLDIYNYLALLKLLDRNMSLVKFELMYTNEIKKLLTPNGSINDLITDSAKALLIFDLLKLKEKELEISNKLLTYISKTTDFFNIENLDKNFNWTNDKLGFKVELEILYWALLGYSQFISKNN